MLGTSGIVGPSILMATGAAYAYHAAEDRPGRASPSSATARQQRRLPRGAQSGDDLESAGPLRLRKQPVRHRSPVRERRASRRASRRERRYGLPGVAVDGNDSWPSTRPPARRSRGPGPVRGRPCSSARPTAPARTPRGCARRLPHAEEINSGRRATDHACCATPDPGRDRQRAGIAAIEKRCARPWSREAVEFARDSPWPDTATATTHVFSMA